MIKKESGIYVRKEMVFENIAVYIAGRRYDKKGNMRQWWSDEAIANFRYKKQCFINQYSKFVTPLTKVPVSLNCAK